MPIETPRTYVNLVFEPDPAPPRRMPHKRLIGGIGALAAVGLVGGFLLAPMMDDGQLTKTASGPVAEAPASSDGLDIVVDDTPALEADPAPPGQLEGILPPIEGPSPAPAPREDPRPASQPAAPEAAQPAAAQPRVSQAAPQRVSPPAAPPVSSASAPAPPPRIVEAPVIRPYAQTPPPAARPTGRARPSFNCRYARTVSERMVCVDPYLAAADRRLARAYSQAIRRGIPEPELRRQQDIWLGLRESATRDGPEGVARAYETRIGELQSMAR